jgi:hypothetical protein
MTVRFKKVIVGVALIAAFALGGAGIASALSSDGGDPGAAAVASDAATGTDDRRADEEALTGDTATRVEEAALAETGGGTVERVETDADGNAAYEAHVVTEDGTRVIVYVDEQFAVVGVEEGGDCPGGPGGRGPAADGDQGTTPDAGASEGADT